MQKSSMTACLRARECSISEETAKDPLTQTHNDIFKATKNSPTKILSLLWYFCAASNTRMQIISEANHAICTQDITFFINLHHGAPSPATSTPNVLFRALRVRAAWS